MEAHSNDLHLSDDQKSVTSIDHLRHNLHNNQLQEVGEQLEEINVQVDVQVKYYLQFKKIYLTSFKLWSEIKKQIKTKDTLVAKITQIDNQLTALHKAKKQEEISEEIEEGQNDSKRRASRRTRRTAQEIERKFYCQAQFCDRCYGSEGSLQQHIKLKHPELYKRQGFSQEF